MTPREDPTGLTDHDRIIKLETNFDGLEKSTEKSEERITGEIEKLGGKIDDLPQKMTEQLTPLIQSEAHKAAVKQVEKHSKDCSGKERVSLKDRVLDWRLLLIVVLAGGTGGGGGKLAEKFLAFLN
jgi:hypothetical protein